MTDPPPYDAPMVLKNLLGRSSHQGYLLRNLHWVLRLSTRRAIAFIYCRVAFTRAKRVVAALGGRKSPDRAGDERKSSGCLPGAVSHSCFILKLVSHAGQNREFQRGARVSHILVSKVGGGSSGRMMITVVADDTLAISGFFNRNVNLFVGLEFGVADNPDLHRFGQFARPAKTEPVRKWGQNRDSQPRFPIPSQIQLRSQRVRASWKQSSSSSLSPEFPSVTWFVGGALMTGISSFSSVTMVCVRTRVMLIRGEIHSELFG